MPFCQLSLCTAYPLQCVWTAMECSKISMMSLKVAKNIYLPELTQRMRRHTQQANRGDEFHNTSPFAVFFQLKVGTALDIQGGYKTMCESTIGSKSWQLNDRDGAVVVIEQVGYPSTGVSFQSNVL